MGFRQSALSDGAVSMMAGLGSLNTMTFVIYRSEQSPSEQRDCCGVESRSMQPRTLSIFQLIRVFHLGTTGRRS